MNNKEKYVSYENNMEDDYVDDDDDDNFDEAEEEEILVYVEFEGTSESTIFCNEKLQLDMIGLDMEHPIMQINGKHYEGTYEEDVGTSLFFEKDPNAVVDDPVFDKPNNLKYFNKVDKVLKMKRVFVKPRIEVLGNSEHPSCIPNMKTIQNFGIPPDYQENALKLWTDKRNERMNALDEYLEKQKQRDEKKRQGIELNSESDDDMPYGFNIENPNEPLIDLTTIANDKNTKPNYKSKTKETNKELTVIDPGPSTSKDSIPWVNPKLEEADSDSDDESLKRDEVVSTEKPEQSGSDNNEDNIDENEAAEILNRDPDDIVASCLLANDQAPMDQDTPLNDNDNDNNGDNENDNNGDNENDDTEMNEDDVANSESSDKLEDTIEDKKAEKKKKREAKMKEITDRLKRKAVDEKTIFET